MASAEVAVPAIASTLENDDPAPLPTKEIARRKSVEAATISRRRTSLSLNSFASDSSVSSDPSHIVEVGNLRFLNDNEMPDGQSAILGKGAFAMVRLAKRRIHQRSSSMVSAVSAVSALSNDDDRNIVVPDGTGGCSNPDTSGHNDAPSENKPTKEEEVLVAVKIFHKSILESVRTIERDDEHQMQVRTALESVEREIAVMKMIQHPNLVSLYEVIDTGSNRLYMVLEYHPRGEILTNVAGTGNYKRRLLRKGEAKLPGVTKDGHFDEKHAALFFVDIMHGLAHLHKNRIAHRDLKPENILIDSRGIAKISDFGVAHLFEEEMKGTGRHSLTDSHQSPYKQRSSISRTESDAALKMKSMSDMGKLTRTEGTWCFWSPEMCAENSLVFSGYACDIWAAGVCLYIFTTGKLPFYSEFPIALFDMIAAAEVKYDEKKLSSELVDLLKKVLTKDPSTRAGVGDCLKHPYCKDAREQRLKELGEGVETHEEVIINREDVKKALTTTRRKSLMNVASGMSQRFLAFRNRISGSQISQKSLMSIDDSGHKDSVDTGAGSKSPRVFAFWRSQKTMSMDDEDDDEGESGTNTRRRGLIPAGVWRPKSQSR